MKYSKWKFTFLVLGILLVALNLRAQLNESDTTKFQLRISAGGNFQNGNVEVSTIKSRLDFTYAPVNNLIIKSQNNSLYQSFYGRKADNDIFSRNYLYFQPQRKIYPFGIAYISTNFRRQIDLRVFAGAGLTWQIINNSSLVVKLAASGVYETTRFNSSVYNFSEYNGNNKIKLWRGTLYTGGWIYLFSNKVRIYYDAYWQPAFNNRNNYRSQLDIGLDIPVWKGLSVNAIYAFTHENVTVLNIKQNDRIITFGLAYQLRKK
jgi:Protein of unknown function, DUF481